MSSELMRKLIKLVEGEVVGFPGNNRPMATVPLSGAKVHNFEPRRDVANMDPFLRGYIEAALWTSSDESDESGGQPMDENYGAEDIAPETFKEMQEDCADFQQANAELLQQSGQSAQQAGHDFWLTRNGHGVGFWDRGLGEVGDRLSDAAHVYGGVDLYLGDDRLIHA